MTKLQHLQHNGKLFTLEKINGKLKRRNLLPLSQKSYDKFKKKVCTPENELKAKFGGKYKLVSPHKREFHPQDWKYWKESNQLVKVEGFYVVWTDGSLSEGRAGSGVY